MPIVSLFANSRYGVGVIADGLELLGVASRDGRGEVCNAGFGVFVCER